MDLLTQSLDKLRGILTSIDSKSETIVNIRKTFKFEKPENIDSRMIV